MKNCFALFYVLTTAFVYGQEPATLKNLNEQNKKQKVYAEKAIVDLSGGALLVRMDFKEKKASYYEKFGDTAAAEKIRQKQLKINQEIIAAFEENFTFCPVYYFAMGDSRKLIDGGPDSLIYYNAEGRRDSSIRVSEPIFFIAEFGQIEQDTTAYYSGTVTETGSENKRRKTYYGGKKNTRGALVIRNNKFEQLREPFPYFVKYAPVGSVRGRFVTPVKQMDRKLRYYLEQVN